MLSDSEAAAVLLVASAVTLQRTGAYRAEPATARLLNRLGALRIPGQTDHRLPAETDHRFRSKPITFSRG